MGIQIDAGGAFRAALEAIPANLERNVLRGALQAGADVFAEGAREECRSAEVRASIQTSTTAKKGTITARIETKGEGAYKAPWLEFGTDPHFITVDAAAAGGKTVGRINRDAKKHALAIGGMFVNSVHHPGAKPYPFMRVSVDTRQDAAIAAIAGHIASRMTKTGLETPDPESRSE